MADLKIKVPNGDARSHDGKGIHRKGPPRRAKMTQRNLIHPETLSKMIRRCSPGNE